MEATTKALFKTLCDTVQSLKNKLDQFDDPGFGQAIAAVSQQACYLLNVELKRAESIRANTTQPKSELSSDPLAEIETPESAALVKAVRSSKPS